VTCLGCRAAQNAATFLLVTIEIPGALRSVTRDEILTFAKEGVVFLPAIIDPEFVGAMAGPVERALTSPETADVGAFAGGSAAPAFRAGSNHWRVDTDFEKFACAGPIPGVAAALLESEGAWLYEDSVLVKEPGAPFKTEFHTDAAYFHVAGSQAATFWVPLDKADASNGAVQYVRGSHLWDRDFRPNLFTIPDPIPGTEGEIVPEILLDPVLREQLIGFELVPGDVVVHHYRTLHGSPSNSSATRRRRAISLRYCGDDIRYNFRPGVPRRPTQVGISDGDLLGAPDTPQVWPL
jgi:ectoine hydroxylase-related dioxygenase (phytanoyl-CoA dioxygenase family)